MKVIINFLKKPTGVALAASLFFIYSCRHEPEDPILRMEKITEPPFDTIACDSGNVTYAGTVVPILETYCLSCHSGPAPSGALDFTDYNDFSFVAKSGRLLGALKHQEGFTPMPQNGGKLSVCEISLIEQWINDTTFVTPPDTSNCDTGFVTYPGNIFPILQANCITCHGPPTFEAGFNFNNYEDVAFLAQSGQLLGAIKHLPGYQPMPKNAPPLTECEITLIEKWVNDTIFNPGGGTGVPCDPDTVYFQNEILPMLQSSCGTTGCHDPGTAEDGVVLTSYLAVMQTAEVVPFNPLESEIYEVIAENDPEDRMPPPPAAPLTPAQINKIYKWISQGALNNYCEQLDCDSLNVSFSVDVFPVIQNTCLGCHSGSNPNGGILLTNYQQIKSQAAISAGSTGSLIGAITWDAGNTNMPYNGARLSDCDIGIIRNWINEGMPNN